MRPERLVGRDSLPVPKDSIGQAGVPSYRLAIVLGSLKKYTALRANRILGRSGSFW
ncbi:MAG: hypothetical protein HYW57_07340 [Ignavibacteriales bacterium]|nr:hypothetical protein [Ignavibacteriales bacterium]